MNTFEEQLAADLAAVMENENCGMGKDITLTDPAEVSYSVKGMWAHISQLIDVDTGVLVTGSFASITLRMQHLLDLGATIPEGKHRESEKIWKVEYSDAIATAHAFKVIESRPDRTLGLVTLILEKVS